MDTGSVVDFIQTYSTELVLILGGLVAILIVYAYLKDKDSKKYTLAVVLGFIFGVLMILISVSGYRSLELSTAAIIAVGGFAMVIRPFRDVHFAAIISLFAMVIAYIFLAKCETIEGLEILGSGWPRVIVAFVAGAIVYMIANFAESIVKIFGKLLNCWPLLLVLGFVCIVEGICVYLGYGSIYDLIMRYQETLTGYVIM
jgi:hypothetical protein